MHPKGDRIGGDAQNHLGVKHDAVLLLRCVYAYSSSSSSSSPSPSPSSSHSYHYHYYYSYCYYFDVRVPICAPRRSFEIKKADARARLPVLIMTRPESTLLPSPVPPPQPCCTLILTTGFSLSTVTLFASTVFSETEKSRRARPSAQMPRGRRSRGQATLYGRPRTAGTTSYPEPILLES